MGREIRRVPANWQHPKSLRKDSYGYESPITYRPMCNWDYGEDVKDYEEALKEWLEGRRVFVTYGRVFACGRDGKKAWINIDEAIDYDLKWIRDERKKNNFSESYRGDRERMLMDGNFTYTDWKGEIPRRPNPDDYMPTGEWYQLFETVSEGTPLSPAFETKAELVDWLTENKDYFGNEWTRDDAEMMVRSELLPTAIGKELT